MNDPHHQSEQPSLSAAQIEEIDQLCGVFEAEWHAGMHPRIEDYLDRAAAPLGGALLSELIALEIDLCQTAGKPVALEDYHRRFPSGGSAVEAGWALIADRKGPDEAEIAETVVQSGQLSPGDVLGSEVSRYRILRPHAKGGLGEVCVAEDTELNREVALKVIRPRFADDESSRGRFVLEAEVTGGLEHPGIVPVYGLGQYADGRPFYAMRFIRGDTLEQAVDRFHHPSGLPGTGQRTEETVPVESTRNLTYDSVDFRKLLGRFIDVCEAIAYAHSRGVLHRDLKPGNIMLGKYGETLVVDWGLAKLEDRDGDTDVVGETALKPRSGSSGAPTQMGSAIGTPAYMPPEQAAGRLDELGPASDVYSLGATFYYLLTGRRPIDGDDLDEVLRKAEIGDFALPRDVRPDIPKPLESICLRAMATRPEDRYGSPQTLADDVERFLADQPVTAHTEPITVRVRRWLRKHPRSMAGLAATLLVGLASTVVIAAVVSDKNQQLASANANLDDANTELTKKNTQLEEANLAERQAKDAAEAKRVEAEQARRHEQLARKEAEKRRREADAVLTFFQDKVLAAARPEDQNGGLGINVTIRAAVDAAEPQIAESFADQPSVEASIRNTLGLTYQYLGELQLAIRQHKRARDLRKAIFGLDNTATLTSTANLASAFEVAGQLNEALPMLEETLKVARETWGPEHYKTLAIMNNLAGAYQSAGHLDRAIPLYEETLKIMKQELGAEHPTTLGVMNNLASAYHSAGRTDQALALLEETLRIRRKTLGPNHVSTLLSMNNLASAYNEMGREDEALVILQNVLKLRKEKLGADHADTLESMKNLANSYKAAGRLDRAIPVYEQALKAAKEKLGTDYPLTLMIMNDLASAYESAGRLGQALPLYEETLKASKEKLGADHPETLKVMNNLASAYYSAGRLDRALPLFEQTLKIRTRRLGAKDPNTLLSMNHLALAYQANGRLDDALPIFEEALKLRKEKLGPEHPATLESMVNLAAAYLSANRPRDAVPIQEEVLKLAKQNLGPDHDLVIGSMGNLAMMYLQVKQPEKALSMFQQFIAANRKLVPANDPRFASLLTQLALTLLQYQQHSAAEAYLRECLSIREKAMPDRWLLFSTQSMLGEALAGQGRTLLASNKEMAVKKFAAAEPLLIAGYEGMKKREASIPAASQVHLIKALGRLVGLYTAWEKSGEAAKWQKLLNEVEAGKNNSPH